MAGSKAAYTGISAHERHTALIQEYMNYYGGAEKIKAAGGWKQFAASQAASQVIQSDLQAFLSGHRFIRTAEDDAGGGLAVRLAKKYYDRLFREYAIADLSRYKESKLGLRWRTEQEVISGKGQFVCGARGCDNKDTLTSFEVNFAYKEAGENKQALVKVRLCPDCGYKLNYKKEKQYRKAQAKELRRTGEGAAGSKRSAEDTQGTGSDRDTGHDRHTKRRTATDPSHPPSALGYEQGEDKDWVLPPPTSTHTATTQQGQQGAGTAAGGAVGPGAGAGGVQQPSVLSADPSVWEHKNKTQDVVTVEEELDNYLESMLV